MTVPARVVAYALRDPISRARPSSDRGCRAREDHVAVTTTRGVLVLRLTEASACVGRWRRSSINFVPLSVPSPPPTGRCYSTEFQTWFHFPVGGAEVLSWVRGRGG